jgi:hypothetical protein
VLTKHRLAARLCAPERYFDDSGGLVAVPVLSKIQNLRQLEIVVVRIFLGRLAIVQTPRNQFSRNPRISDCRLASDAMAPAAQAVNSESARDSVSILNWCSCQPQL